MPGALTPPGLLYITRGRPNPAGGATALYLLHGDATAAPIRAVAPAPGVTLPPAAGPTAESPFRLTLLHFNDLHHRLADVTPGEISAVFSRMAQHVRTRREGCAGRSDAGLLVLSAGDDLAGAPFDELIGRPSDYRCAPAYRLYSAAGVDAAAIGNHDLDWGLALLAHAVRHEAAFPLLAANLAFGAGWGVEGNPGILPAVLFVVNGLRVGVVGLITPAEIKRADPAVFAVTDPIQAARHLLPAVRPLCDVLIILTHLGYSLESSTAVMAGAGDVELARALPRGAAHLIIGGHTHSALNPGGLHASNIVNGIPIVQAGSRGAYLGEVHVVVGPAGAAVTDARLHRVPDLPGDERFEAEQVRPVAERVRTLLGQPIGRVANHPDLNTTNVRERFASAESALANFIADGLAARCRTAGAPVDFALVDASSVAAGLPLCDVLTFSDLFRLLPYADSVALCRLTPAQLLALLDDNARRADRPDEPHTERGFLQFSREVRYAVVLGPERRAAHAASPTVAGAPLVRLLETRSEPFLVACSSFVRELAAPWERCSDAAGLNLWDLRAHLVQDTGRLLRGEMSAFVREHGGVIEETGLRRDGRVRFD